MLFDLVRHPSTPVDVLTSVLVRAGVARLPSTPEHVLADLSVTVLPPQPSPPSGPRMYSCAESPHAACLAISIPSETAAHGATVGAATVIDCVHGTPEHQSPGAIAPSAVHAPSRLA